MITYFLGRIRKHIYLVYMKVTTHNYMLPLIFSYKGWQVTLSDNSGIFTLADMKVKVEIEIATWQYAATLYQAYTEEMKRKRYGLAAFNSRLTKQEEQQSKEAYNHYLQLAEKFAMNKRVEYSFNVNGGMLDRFMGQNISAIEKAKQQVAAYIDTNLGNVWEEFIQFISKQ